MCIRHTQVFRCPSKEGSTKKHCIKSNILCSDHYPCPESQWERRSSEYRYMCPSCSGEPPEVPREKPLTDHWERDISQDEVWVHNYVDGLCNSALIWRWGKDHARSDRVSIQAMTGLYPSFFLERRCKEHKHRPSHCRCEPNGPLAYLYNPAMAARRHFTNETASEFATNTHVQSEMARQALEDVHQRLKAMCGQENIYFQGGIARQPFFSSDGIARRRQTMERVFSNAWRAFENEVEDSVEATGGEWTDAHTLVETKALRRKSFVQFLGEIVLYDNGFSMARFCLVVERLASIIQTPQWRDSADIMGLEKMANVVSAYAPVNSNSEEDATDPFGKFTEEAVDYFAGKREAWAREIRNYTAKRSLFDESTKPMDDTALQAAIREGIQEECPICYVRYWENPSPDAVQSPTGPSPTAEQRPGPPGRQLVSQPSNATTSSRISNQIRRLKWDDDPEVLRRIFGANPAGVCMYDRGEPPVRLTMCGHVFGRSCLFRAWVTEANDPENPSRSCPMCRVEPPEGTYRLAAASARGRGRAMSTNLLSVLAMYNILDY